MREGYQLDPRGPANTVDLVAPGGKSIARVNRNTIDVIAIIESYVPAIAAPNVNDEAELEDALDAIAEEHYRLTSSRHQQIRDRLNKWVDYPIVKLIVIVAAIVAATASVRGCMT